MNEIYQVAIETFYTASKHQAESTAYGYSMMQGNGIRSYHRWQRELVNVIRLLWFRLNSAVGVLLISI